MDAVGQKSRELVFPSFFRDCKTPSMLASVLRPLKPNDRKKESRAAESKEEKQRRLLFSNKTAWRTLPKMYLCQCIFLTVHSLLQSRKFFFNP